MAYVHAARHECYFFLLAGELHAHNGIWIEPATGIKHGQDLGAEAAVDELVMSFVGSWAAQEP